MKLGFYRKLAWQGIRKNKRLYTPYLLTCAGMVMMHYIVTFLSITPAMDASVGGGTVQGLLGFGSWIIALFSLIFLFYTNSFLIRRRKKEFGLYNILGMSKGKVSRILLWDAGIVAVISLSLGLFSGVVLSKLFELGLVRLLRGTVSYRLFLSWDAMKQTLSVYLVIFSLIFLNGLRQVRLANPVTLLRSESAGEKPPKANWFLGLAGALILGGAYYLAVSIQNPLDALIWFFVAVILVIIATYLLFIAGSVVFCRILQKRKGYYYKANHFVSVSSMAYRMKRNGAGLASICILITMVLVILSSTTCLYLGIENTLAALYPRDVAVSLNLNSTERFSEETAAHLYDTLHTAATVKGDPLKKELAYRYASVAGLLEGDAFETDVSKVNDFDIGTYGQVYLIYWIPLADYNRLTGEDIQLAEDEALVHAVRSQYGQDAVSVKGGPVYRVKAVLADFPIPPDYESYVVPSLYVVVPDLEAAVSPIASLTDYNGNPMVNLGWSYSFDIPGDPDTQEAVFDRTVDALRELSMDPALTNGGCSYIFSPPARQNSYASLGGLFFLGIMLSAVFVFATVLILYYKQVSEGYEDQSRFEIMQKVGMTKKMIRKSINSQMLTVFFLPLLLAGLHLSFAYPIVETMLYMFGILNKGLLAATTAVSFLVFALFYCLVYRATANAYYAIVSTNEK